VRDWNKRNQNEKERTASPLRVTDTIELRARDQSWQHRPYSDLTAGKEMADEYQTLKFANDKDGIRKKDQSVTQMATSGWRVIGESIEAGHIKGGKACCLASVCLPLGFLSGRTRGAIVVSLAREAAPSSSPDTEGSTLSRDTGRGLGARLGFILGRLAGKLRR
jgi:hypothetical protein